MIKGHMDQTRKNQRSTRTAPSPLLSPPPVSACSPPLPLPDDVFPPSDSPNQRSHFCYAAIMAPTGQVYTDQTGRFITPSSNGKNYLLILYNYDSNAILAEPLKDCTGAAILAGYQKLHGALSAAVPPSPPPCRPLRRRPPSPTPTTRQRVLHRA
jgi:hypothetical protein